MKNIFRSLLVLLMPILFVGQISADETVTGKVRYAIEHKKLTKQEALKAVSDGYVDLYTYAFFDEGFIGHGITLNASNQVQSWNLRFGSNSHSYVIVDASGNFDQSGAVATFAPAAYIPSPENPSIICNASHYQDEVSQGLLAGVGVIEPGWQSGGCPTWNFGAECVASQSLGVNGKAFIIDTVINGKRWFGVKMYKIRYLYSKAESFYTRFYVGPSLGLMSIGSSNMNLYSASAMSSRILGQGVPRNNQDWSYYMQYPGEIGSGGSADMYELWTGGVEVIASPEFALNTTTACSGSDMSGTFKVINWNNGSWSGFKAGSLKVSVKNTAGNQNKALAIGTDLVFSGNNLATILGTASTVDDFPFTLTPAAYMMNGVPADSLIWAFEEEKMILI